MSLRLSAARYSSRLRMIPNLVKITVFGPRPEITSAAYLLRPETTEITATIVATAMMMPSRLRNRRSLWAVSEASADAGDVAEDHRRPRPPARQWTGDG